MPWSRARGVVVHSGAAVAVVLSIAVLPASPARAATIQVTTTADESGGGAACSLREAILSANGDAALGGCSAGSASTTDLIILPAGSYGLAAAGTNEDAGADGDLDITGSVVIQGVSDDVTVVDGNGSAGGERVFQVFAPAVVTISGVTIHDGHGGAGGGIANSSCSIAG